MSKSLSPYSFSLNKPVLTRKRMWAAVTIAVMADALQIMFGPLGLVGIDQGIDLAAAAFTIGLLGFHPLLLPTFIIELIPVASLIPTWTGCVLFVLALRRKAQTLDAPPTITVHPPEVTDKQR